MTLIILSFAASLYIAPKYLNKFKNKPNYFVLTVMSLLVFFIFVIIQSTKVNAENRIRVAIIDTGINTKLVYPYLCKDGHKDFTNKGLFDEMGHGTNIAGIISKKLNNKTHCLQIIKWFHTEKASNNESLKNSVLGALKHALLYKAKYVNLSMSGSYHSVEEYELLKQLIKSGAKIFVAAGNEAKNLSIDCSIYPACYEIHNSNFVVVGNYNAYSSNYGINVRWENGTNVEGFGIVSSGTSQATAVYLSKQLLKDSYE
jgi:hypothetical protein